MSETNKTLDQKVRDWWRDNKKVIKAGIVCGITGLAYGFIKGVVTVSSMVVNGDITVVRTEKSDNDSGELTAEKCDNPELVVQVEIEKENS